MIVLERTILYSLNESTLYVDSTDVVLTLALASMSVR